mgnify:CR=1 FL=1
MFYNWGMLKAQELYRKIPFMKETGRLLIAFLTAGVLGIVMPWVLGSGSGLIVSLTQGEMVLGMVVLTLVMKFLFSAVMLGSERREEFSFRFDIRRFDRSSICHGGGRIFWLGSGVCQQFCTAWDDRILYSDCKSTADGDYPVI